MATIERVAASSSSSSGMRQRRPSGDSGVTRTVAAPAASSSAAVLTDQEEEEDSEETGEEGVVVVDARALEASAPPMSVPASVAYPNLAAESELEYVNVDAGGEMEGFGEGETGADEHAPLLRAEGSMPEPSAPSFEEPGGVLHQVGGMVQRGSAHQPALYASSIVHPNAAPHTRAQAPSIFNSQSPNGPSQSRKLSPRAAARLAQLKAKADLAEMVEEREERAIARGEIERPRPEPISLVKHKVLPGDDLTDLAVRYGSSVASIKAANRRIVFEVLDNVWGEVIDIPATRVPVDAPVDPAASALAAKRNQEFFARRSFLTEAGGRCTEAEASFYLEENDWEVQAALEQWRDDVAWDAEQQRLGKAAGRSNIKGGPAAAARSQDTFEMQSLIRPGAVAGSAQRGMGSSNLRAGR